MSTLRDVIAGAVCGAWGADGSQYLDEDVADSILATPEMQAIRKALRALIAIHGLSPTHPLTRTWRTARTDLPESVIAWVLDGDE